MPDRIGDAGSEAPIQDPPRLSVSRAPREAGCAAAIESPPLASSLRARLAVVETFKPHDSRAVQGRKRTPREKVDTSLSPLRSMVERLIVVKRTKGKMSGDENPNAREPIGTGQDGALRTCYRRVPCFARRCLPLYPQRAQAGVCLPNTNYRSNTPYHPLPFSQNLSLSSSSPPFLPVPSITATICGSYSQLSTPGAHRFLLLRFGSVLRLVLFVHSRAPPDLLEGTSSVWPRPNPTNLSGPQSLLSSLNSAWIAPTTFYVARYPVRHPASSVSFGCLPDLAGPNTYAEPSLPLSWSGLLELNVRSPRGLF